MKRSDEFLANPTLVSLIDAAAIGDAETFRDGVNQLQEAGWDGIDRIVAEFQSRLGSHPTVGDIVNLSQALYPFTSMFLNASQRARP